MHAALVLYKKFFFYIFKNPRDNLPFSILINMHVFFFFLKKHKIPFFCWRRHPNWRNTIYVLWCWMANIVAKLMTQEGFDWSSGWLIIKLQSIFGCSFISHLNNSVPGCMARQTAMAKHIFTLQSLLSMVMLPLFIIQ